MARPRLRAKPLQAARLRRGDASGRRPIEVHRAIAENRRERALKYVHRNALVTTGSIRPIGGRGRALFGESPE